MIQKKCSCCNNIKELDRFHKLKKGKSGRHSHCKECRSKHRKQLNYERPEGFLVKCLKCNEVKDQRMFYKNKSSSLGVQAYCIECHKEKIYESQSKLDGYISKIYNSLLIFSRKKGIENSISKEDLMEIYVKQNTYCALTGEQMTYYSGKSLTDSKYESKYNIAIDRINLDKGFTKNNVQLVGNMIAQMKQKTHMNNDNFIKLCELISEKKLNS